MTPRDRIKLRREAATYQHLLMDFRSALEDLSLTLDAIDNGVVALVGGDGGDDALRALQAHTRLVHVARDLPARAEALAKAETPLRLAAFFGREGTPSDESRVEAAKLVAEVTGGVWTGEVLSMEFLHGALKALAQYDGHVVAMELLPELDKILFPHAPGELVFVDEEKP